MAVAYKAQFDFCLAVLNSLHEKYKGQIEAKFSAPYKYMRISIFSKKLFRTVDIENILNV